MYENKRVTLKCFFFFFKGKGHYCLDFYLCKREAERVTIIQPVTKQKILKYIDKKKIRTVNNRSVSFEKDKQVTTWFLFPCSSKDNRCLQAHVRF